jgi:hypothetical protein
MTMEGVPPKGGGVIGVGTAGRGKAGEPPPPSTRQVTPGSLLETREPGLGEILTEPRPSASLPLQEDPPAALLPEHPGFPASERKQD